MFRITSAISRSPGALFKRSTFYPSNGGFGASPVYSLPLQRFLTSNSQSHPKHHSESQGELPSRLSDRKSWTPEQVHIYLTNFALEQNLTKSQKETILNEFSDLNGKDLFRLSLEKIRDRIKDPILATALYGKLGGPTSKNVRPLLFPILIMMTVAGVFLKKLVDVITAEPLPSKDDEGESFGLMEDPQPEKK